jgi:hypothetical protein
MKKEIIISFLLILFFIETYAQISENAHWNWGATVAPVYLNNSRFPLYKETSSVNISAGLTLTRNINRSWSIESGLNFLSWKYQSPETYLNSNYSHYNNYLFPGYYISQCKLLSVPVLVNYKTDHDVLNFKIGLGFNWNLLLFNKWSTYNTGSGTLYAQGNSVRAQPFSFTAVIKPGIELSLSKKTSLSLTAYLGYMANQDLSYNMTECAIEAGFIKKISNDKFPNKAMWKTGYDGKMNSDTNWWGHGAFAGAAITGLKYKQDYHNTKVTPITCATIGYTIRRHLLRNLFFESGLNINSFGYTVPIDIDSLYDFDFINNEWHFTRTDTNAYMRKYTALSLPLLLSVSTNTHPLKFSLSGGISYNFIFRRTESQTGYENSYYGGKFKNGIDELSLSSIVNAGIEYALNNKNRLSLNTYFAYQFTSDMFDGNISDSPIHPYSLGVNIGYFRSIKNTSFPNKNKHTKKDPKEHEIFRKNNYVYAELLGSGIYYSLNYERNLTKGSIAALTGRIGVTLIPHTTIAFPVAFYLDLGRSKSKFETGLGMTFTSADMTDLEGYIIPSIAYRLESGKYFFRLAFTPLLEGLEFDEYSQVALMGVSFGRIF